MGRKLLKVNWPELRMPLIHLRRVSERWKLKVVGFTEKPSIWTRKEKAIVLSFFVFPLRLHHLVFPRGHPFEY